MRPGKPGGEAAPRHNREYTPREIRQLLVNSGFETVRLETGEFRDSPHPEYGWVAHLLERYKLDTNSAGTAFTRSGEKPAP